MIKAWLLDEMFRFDRRYLTAEGSQSEWGAGDSVAEEEDLPPAPTGVAAKAGNGRVMIPRRNRRRSCHSISPTR